MEAFECRRRAFLGWKSAPLGEVIGSGKYATVFRSNGSAAKVMDLSGKSKRARMQAYREHVVSMMQTILLLRHVTSQYPFHYGFKTLIGEMGMTLTMFMESFEGSLQDLAERVLTDSDCWIHLVLQLLHACVCMASIFGVVHNDLYPRNVLVRMLPGGQRTRLVVDGVMYVFLPRFLVVVADYGIASGRLVGAHSVPEVCASTVKVARSPRFSLQPPEAHILQYDPVLPAFSRDPYTVLKWVVYGQKNLPQAAFSVRLWGMEALNRIDLRLEDFHEELSQLPLFHHLFHEDNLRRFGLASSLLYASPEKPEELLCTLRFEDKEVMVSQAAAALQELGKDESEWVVALRKFREHQKKVSER